MKEIIRDNLHSSIRSKPIEVQDKFLEVVNTLIRKGSNTSYAIQEANKAIVQFEIELREKELAKQKEIKKQTRIKLEKALENSIKLPPIIQNEDIQVDPEEIESIFFDDEGKLIIRFGDGFIIKSKNIAPTKLIEERTAIATQYPFFDWVQFNVDAFENNILPHEEGLLFYDKKSHSLAYYNDESDVTVNIGQETLLRVYNDTASTLLNGKVVYISGAFSGWPTAALASSSVKLQAYSVLGMVTADIEPNTYGYVCITGKVNDIDTSSYSVGTVLYLSTTSGEVTNIPPLQPNYVVVIGDVIANSATNGSVLVHIDRREWFPSLQLLAPATSITLPTTPTVFKPTDIVYNDGFSYDNTTGEITFLESSNYTFTIQFNAYPSASNKNIYFYIEEFDGSTWNIGRYTARQIRLVNQVEDQVQVTAARYFKVNNKIRFKIWGDATVQLRSTDLSGTNPGTVTLPAFRLNVA